MNSIIEVINNIKLPIIIWENMECIHSNNNTVKKGDTIQEYLSKEYINNYTAYVNNVIITKIGARIKTYSKIICIEDLSDTSYYEIHYPIYIENELMGVTIYKLRKSLTDIINYVQTNTHNRHTESNELIKHTCETIMSLTNDIIDVFHIGKNKLVYGNEYFHIDKLMDECTNHISVDTNKKKLQVTAFISPYIKTKLYTDYSKIKQIMLNILDNAVRFTQIGGIFITIEYHTNNLVLLPVTLDSKYICITVKDTGIGMGDDTKCGLSMLMNVPSSEVCDKTDYKKTKMQGFGLFISYHLCHFLKGFITFKSEKDMGSVFYIVFPERLK